jgi:inosose dehydratase
MGGERIGRRVLVEGARESRYALAMHSSRRSFLKSAAAVTATAFFPAGLRAQDEEAKKKVVGGMVGSQMYGWGQYYTREGKKLEEHLGEALSALRDAGYQYAEHNLGSPEQSAKFAEELKTRGMKPVSLYTGGALHDAAVADKTVKSLIDRAAGAKEAGFRIINCNPDAVGRVKTDAELNTQAKALQTLGTELRALGMQLGVHHHTPEFANKAKEFHSNFAGTEPKDVGFCYDVHWVFRGGVPPEEALEAYGSRIVSWHLRQSRAKIWWEDLAEGDVDYAAISAYAKKHHLPPLYTVELAIEAGTKITRTVVENHQRSRDFVKEVFGV